MKRLSPVIDPLAPGEYPVSVVDRYAGRGQQYTYGLDHVVRHSRAFVTEVIKNKKDIKKVQNPYILMGLTSPLDVYALVDFAEHRPFDSRLVVGGFGATPFLSYREVVDSIFFGRAEGLEDLSIRGCTRYHYVGGTNSLPIYIRRPRFLIPGETSLGCQGVCAFCQYRAVRPFFGSGDYSPNTLGHKVVEDRWQDIQSKTGNQTTALDGFSEYTRRKIRKPISDDEIVETLTRVLQEINGIMRLKVFLILGYPWETLESVRHDLSEFRKLLSKVKPKADGSSRIMMMVTTTPFSPEPLTDMELLPANIEINWNHFVKQEDVKCIVDFPHLNAFFLPQVPGPLLLYKRVAVNRASSFAVISRLKKAKNIDEAVKIGGTDLVSRIPKKRSYSNILRLESNTQ